MRKYRWAIIAGVCVLVLIVVGAVLIPRLFHRNPAPPSIPESQEIVIPAHWWQTSLTEQQLEVLRGAWGTEIGIKQFLEAIWPSMLDELPSEAVDSLGDHTVWWTYESFEEWEEAQSMYFALRRVPEKGAIMVEFYFGRREEEREASFMTPKGSGIVPDNCYRISMYTDDVVAATS